MHYSVVWAEYVGGYRVRIGFADGMTGVVDLAPYTRRAGVFRKLKDPAYFRHFRINADFGVICWGAHGEVDIAPETLYELAGGQKAGACVAEEKAVYARKRARRSTQVTSARKCG